MYLQLDSSLLDAARAACVALPAAGLPPLLRRLRSPGWALLVPMSIVAVACLVAVSSAGADALARAALLLVPPGCALAFGWAAHGARPRLAVLAVPLLGRRRGGPGGDCGRGCAHRADRRRLRDVGSPARGLRPDRAARGRRGGDGGDRRLVPLRPPRRPAGRAVPRGRRGTRLAAAADRRTGRRLLRLRGLLRLRPRRRDLRPRAPRAGLRRGGDVPVDAGLQPAVPGRRLAAGDGPPAVVLLAVRPCRPAPASGRHRR
jgi:hypothetical protein